MELENYWQPNSAGGYLARLDQYKDAVVRLFPPLSRRAVDAWLMFPADALALGYFLECCPRKVVALDVGAVTGASAFFLAGHPRVSSVISLGPNPTVGDMLAANPDTQDTSVDLEPLKGLKILDVAHAVFEEFHDEREKVQFREGVVVSDRMNVEEDSSRASEDIDIPRLDTTGIAGPVALVDRLYTREEARANLAAIFERNPHAIVLLDGCRRRGGLFVQAGVADFIEQTGGDHHFQLIGDLGPGLATSNLGIVYPNPIAAEATRILGDLNSTFSHRLDPLRLLRREEDLIGVINQTKERLKQAGNARGQLQKRNAKLQKRNANLKQRNRELQQINKDIGQIEKQNSRLRKRTSELEKHNAQLVAHYSSRRYKLTDTLAGSVSRIPGLRILLRRTTA